MKPFALSIAVVALFTAAANADQQYKVWNEFFAGTWQLESEGGRAEQDLKLVADGEALIGTSKSDSGKTLAWIQGWYPAKKQIVHQWFGANHGRALYKVIDDKTLRGRGEIHDSDTITKGTVTITKNGEDSFTVHWTELTANGEKVKDIRVEATRK